jgi:hypothetical protein
MIDPDRRCIECGRDATPRFLYCSDACRDASKAAELSHRGIDPNTEPPPRAPATDLVPPEWRSYVDRSTWSDELRAEVEDAEARMLRAVEEVRRRG